jgi:nucleotide-binding universal stress UspA family protein
VIHRKKENKTNKVVSLNNPPHMVMAVDGSEESRRNLCWAVENALPSRVSLTLLYIQDTMPDEFGFMEAHDTASIFLDSLIGLLGSKSRRQIRKHIGASPDKGHFIVDYCKRTNADLLMIATRGQGVVGRQFMGSVSDYVLHNLTCPILVYKDYTTNSGAKRREDAAASNKEFSYVVPQSHGEYTQLQ